MTFGSAYAQNSGTLTDGGFSVATDGSLSLNRKRATHPAVDVVFTIGAEASNVRNISVQLKNSTNSDVQEVTAYELFVLAGASDALATGGSTGIADAGAGSILQTVTAKQRFTMLSNANGLTELSWTDTGTESVRLAVRLPNGNFIISDAFANS